MNLWDRFRVTEILEHVPDIFEYFGFLASLAYTTPFFSLLTLLVGSSHIRFELLNLIIKSLNLFNKLDKSLEIHRRDRKRNRSFYRFCRIFSVTVWGFHLIIYLF